MTSFFAIKRNAIRNTFMKVPKMFSQLNSSITSFMRHHPITLFPYLAGLIFGGVCDSVASELAARRTAMEAATDNAEEMIEKLNLFYNRAMQASITQPRFRSIFLCFA